ncbi:hypothetical protein F4781DRAFT_409158 [Annulohypoxylon bovei var. microspora]|nr:hypothetical protein F4781DRAFT_409158 [Annulohypoxylon bovei var. microspora]
MSMLLYTLAFSCLHVLKSFASLIFLVLTSLRKVCYTRSWINQGLKIRPRSKQKFQTCTYVMQQAKDALVRVHGLFY